MENQDRVEKVSAIRDRLYAEINRLSAEADEELAALYRAEK